MAKLAQFMLGVVYPVVSLTMGLGLFIIYYSHLPNRITVLFDITRKPIISLSTPIFCLLLATILALAALACIKVAISRKPIINTSYRTVASYGGFFSLVASSLMAGAVAIHSDLDNWYDATGPGWWLLVVIFIGVSGSECAKWLAVKVHEPSTDISSSL